MQTAPPPRPQLPLLSALIGLVALAACGSAQLAPPLDLKVEPGPEIALPGVRATMAVPKGMKAKRDGTFLLIHQEIAWIGLKVTVQPNPETDADAWIDAHVALVQRSGNADILRNDRVTLGDLDARLIAAEDLLGERRAALLQMVAPAEDGIYVATFFGSAQTVRAHAKALVRALMTLRIPQLEPSAGETIGGDRPPPGAGQRSPAAPGEPPAIVPPQVAPEVDAR